MTNYAKIWLILANYGRIYGQKWPDLWPNEIVGMAMAIVAIPDITAMHFIKSLLLPLLLLLWARPLRNLSCLKIWDDTH